MITIKTTADHEITVQSCFSLAFKDACKSIPGRTWDPERRAWVFPATPLVAKEIADRLTGQPFFSDDEFDKLVERGRNETRLPDGESILPATAIPPPDSKTECWAHQLVGYGNLLTRPANLLAWDMRTGKTKAIVDAVVNLPDVNLVLVVCRKTIIHVWPAEFEEHAATPVRVLPLDKGTIAVRASKAKQAVQLHTARMGPEPLVLVINYQAVWRSSFAEFALTTAWDAIICDEIQHIMSPRGTASRFMAQLAKVTKRRVGLSGRPMPHGPENIFAEFRFLDVSIFGRYVTYFRNRYLIMGGYQVNGRPTKVLGLNPKHAAEFNAKVASITQFVTLDEVLPNLPPVTHMTHLVDLEHTTAQVYRDLERDLVTQVEAGLVTAANAMVKMMRLQQVTSGFLPLDREETRGEIVNCPVGNEKGKALAELLDDLPPAEPVVVFCRFRHDLDVIKEVTRKCKRIPFELSGRVNELLPWQRGSGSSGLSLVPSLAAGSDVLAVQIQTGDEGVDFTRARYCVYYSTGYISPGHFDQTLARPRGIKQTRPVTYIHLLARNTIDEKVYRALRAGQDMIEAVIEGIKNETQPSTTQSLAAGA